MCGSACRDYERADFASAITLTRAAVEGSERNYEAIVPHRLKNATSRAIIAAGYDESAATRCAG